MAVIGVQTIGNLRHHTTRCCLSIPVAHCLRKVNEGLGLRLVGSELAGPDKTNLGLMLQQWCRVGPGYVDPLPLHFPSPFPFHSSPLRPFHSRPKFGAF